MNNLKTFNKIKNHFNNNIKINDLFKNNPNRALEFSFELDDLFLDISKNNITKETIDLFVELAEEANLIEEIQNMFSGEKINFTENRAVLHTALRNPSFYNTNTQTSSLKSSSNTQQNIIVDNHNYAPDIANVFHKMCDFTNKLHSREITTINNERFEYIVNIGIGGSYLGTAMAYNALENQSNNNIKVYFISNVDSNNLCHVLNQIDIAKTLFIVASKTFTTQETMINAYTAKDILIEVLGKKALEKHFVALSTNLEATRNFGIKDEYTFGFWDFIGGRYSIWSAIGLPLMIKIGVDNFKAFLNGANIVDNHFKISPLQKNIPFLLAIIGIWYNNFYNYNSYSILAYDYRLRDFTRYIQQLEMESNGKYISKTGKKVPYNTSPVVFGEPGTDAQHSFFQMIHQGTTIIPCDFIGFCNGYNNKYYSTFSKSMDKKPDNKNNTLHFKKAHQALIANMFAQAESLMMGKNQETVKQELQKQNLSEDQINKLAPHKVFEGNRPSNILLFKELSPKTLGMLCAIYEHKIFTQGILWRINSFDQWGVELGKQLANHILDNITGNKAYNGSASSLCLLKKYKQWNNYEE